MDIDDIKGDVWFHGASSKLLAGRTLQMFHSKTISIFTHTKLTHVHLAGAKKFNISEHNDNNV